VEEWQCYGNAGLFYGNIGFLAKQSNTGADLCID